ncbi:MAG: arginase [Bacteriovoracaceae bacterium]|nr:arginase [Bacteriovoracaceae bacterium]
MHNECSLIGAAVDIGQPKEGTELAPSWLRMKGFRDVFEKNFSKVHDLGDFSAIKKETNPSLKTKFNQLSRYSQNLGEVISQELEKNRFVFTLGGDHSLAVGTLAGTLGHDPNVKIIWVDAHADINTPETSPSHNTHGMPVALAMGLVKHEDAKGQFDWMPRLRPENIAYIGLRDVDPGEQKFIDDLGILAFTAEETKKLGIEKVLETILKNLDPEGESNFHISFDVDGIDPQFFPSTGTPVAGGISLEEGKTIIESFVSTGRLLALDMVEVNPLLGNAQALQKTLESSISLVEPLRANTSPELWTPSHSTTVDETQLKS